MQMPDQTYAEFRSRICDAYLVAFAIMAVPTLAASLWRITEIGWQPVMAIQIALAICLWLIALTRKGISYRVRATFLIVCFIAVALSGIWTFGLAAGGVVWLVTIPILASILFSLRSALIIFTGAMLVALAIAVLFVSGYRIPAYDPNVFLTSVPAWATAMFSWVLVGASTAIAIGALNRFFVASLETSRQRAEALAESEREYRNILENMVDTFYRADTDGRIVTISPSVAGLAGYAREELTGRKLTEFYVDPDRREEFLRQLHDGGGRVSDFEAEILDKAGERLWVSTSARYWQDVQGNVLGVEGTIRNITANKEAEAALRRSQKMEAVGQLTGGVAHDFNNLLGVMIGNAELLEDAIGSDAAARHNVEAIYNAVERGSSLTRRLLAFSRQQALSPRTTALNQVILGLEEMLRRTLGEKVVLRLALQDDLHDVLIDPYQFEDALVNLALNARDAMPNGGELVIETANSSAAEIPECQLGKDASAAYVKVAVRDEGTGMTAETRERAFEPFFTTKEVGAGSGLGLSMVYGFVSQSGGHVAIASTLGEGTTVTLYLPRSNVLSMPDDAAVQVPEPARGSGRVLVVEDDDELRKIPRSIFRGQGYEVVEARDGKEAIRRLREGPPFDLLFTDMVLPGGVDGREVAETAARLQPAIKVLFTSGYSEHSFVHSGEQVPDIMLITKPYRRTELLQKIRELLDGGEARPS
jgi:PAS domain S-box-containing protein